MPSCGTTSRMRRTTTRKIEPPQATAARRVTQRKARSQGWLSTDDEEVERRRQRAAEEPFTVEAIEPEQPVFGTFRVESASGGAYEVEIRSLARRDNSCGCPDHRVNGLGTCKHVEAALASLSAAQKRKAAGQRIEVFLRRAGASRRCGCSGRWARAGPGRALCSRRSFRWASCAAIR
jgi:hypothetical protein